MVFFSLLNESLIKGLCPPPHSSCPPPSSPLPFPVFNKAPHSPSPSTGSLFFPCVHMLSLFPPSIAAGFLLIHSFFTPLPFSFCIKATHLLFSPLCHALCASPSQCLLAASYEQLPYVSVVVCSLYCLFPSLWPKLLPYTI